MNPYRVLFVCWGNICRSPTAEGILRRQIEAAGLDRLIEVDSAGVSAEHAGDRPDRRAMIEADRRGLDLRGLRSRQVTAEDWERHDLLLVTDEVVERTLLRSAPPGPARRKVARITAFGAEADGREPLPAEVPDPYYGGPDGFALVYDILDQACTEILAHARLKVEGLGV